MEEDLIEVIRANLVDTDDNKEERRGRINANAKDKASIRRKLTECRDALDPSKYPPSLVNIITDKIAPTSATVAQAIYIANSQIIEFENSLTDTFYGSISK
ncbi:hypothetical protein DPMN_044813 [Dreissena polymorpha]|uniref:Uncharacterized protein n=1 Tax=Dreissena polymorpha TaxID=45954 RepID=A0A9D4D540_DREPO|nr:hypothetical protein DPMN_044813 [Dreissena polymorpha]